MRPFIILRNLTFFGASTLLSSYLSKAPFECRLRLQGLNWKHFALVDPGLYTDLPHRRARFGKPVVHLGPKGMKRYPALAIPFGPRDFRSSEAAGDHDL